MPDSGRVADAFAAVINGLRLNPDPKSIRQRKKLTLLEGEVLPLILVAVGEEESFEPVAVGTTADKLLWSVKRVVSLGLLFDKSGKQEDNASLRSWRNIIWPAFTLDALHRLLPEINDVMPTGKPIFEPTAAAVFDCSTLTYTVETLEERPR